MKRFILTLLAVALLGATNAFAAGKLLSVDEAIATAAMEIEAKIAAGSEIAVYKIVCNDDIIGNFLCEELTEKFNGSGKLKTLARGKALSYVDEEQEFQMFGMVTDASVVSIGQFLGAKVVISGTFDRYDGFDQLRLRAVDVRTSELTTAYGVRTDSKDKVLATITKAPKQKAAKVTDTVLDILNAGKDLYEKGDFDNAIAELTKAIAMDKKNAEAYYHRGNAYYKLRDANVLTFKWEVLEELEDKALADFNVAIKLKSNYIDALNNRGCIYWGKENYNKALADFGAVLRIEPDHIDALCNRGAMYVLRLKEYDLAITDFTAVLKIEPNNSYALIQRAYAYLKKGDHDRAIADYTSALKIEPNNKIALNNRGMEYHDKGDFDKAIADYEAILRIEPNDSYTKELLAKAKQGQKRR